MVKRHVKVHYISKEIPKRQNRENEGEAIFKEATNENFKKLKTEDSENIMNPKQVLKKKSILRSK